MNAFEQGPDPTREILDVKDLEQLREASPERLYRHLDELRQRFLFGVERVEDEAWGGAFRVLLNRNIALHLVYGFDEEMPDRASLPQFCAMPDEERADTVLEHSQELDGAPLPGLIFYVEPFEFDELLRDASQVAEAYPGWDMLPDSYYLHSELVRWLGRTVLEHPQIAVEREFDFRLGVPGLVPGLPPGEEPLLSAEELIAQEAAGTYEPDPMPPERDEDDDDDDLQGMRSHPVEMG